MGVLTASRGNPLWGLAVGLFVVGGCRKDASTGGQRSEFPLRALAQVEPHLSTRGHTLEEALVVKVPQALDSAIAAGCRLLPGQISLGKEDEADRSVQRHGFRDFAHFVETQAAVLNACVAVRYLMVLEEEPGNVSLARKAEASVRRFTREDLELVVRNWGLLRKHVARLERHGTPLPD